MSSKKDMTVIIYSSRHTVFVVPIVDEAAFEKKYFDSDYGYQQANFTKTYSSGVVEINTSMNIDVNPYDTTSHYWDEDTEKWDCWLL